jgi:hypothetical protein
MSEPKRDSTVRYFDRQGRRITAAECVPLWADHAQRRVAVTDVSADVRVSTVWLGLDHSWDDGPPLIFETLVFGGPLDGEMERYSTEAQAIAGHAAMVERCEQNGSGDTGHTLAHVCGCGHSFDLHMAVVGGCSLCSCEAHPPNQPDPQNGSNQGGES